MYKNIPFLNKKIQKDIKNSLKSKCLTPSYKKDKSYYLNLPICLYNEYNKFKVHVVWLVF